MPCKRTQFRDRSDSIQLFNGCGCKDWNICPEVLGMTKGQMFQSIAPETIK